MAVAESVSEPLIYTTPTRSPGLKRLPFPRRPRTIPDNPRKKKTARVVIKQPVHNGRDFMAP